MQIQPSSIIFPSYQGGEQVMTADVTLPAAVSQATAILTGFDVEFTNHGEGGRPFGMLDIRLDVQGVNGATVSVQVSYGLRDWSRNWDDPFDGTIYFTVIGE
jgi:hypothetical protein